MDIEIELVDADVHVHPAPTFWDEYFPAKFGELNWAGSSPVSMKRRSNRWCATMRDGFTDSAEVSRHVN
jgi:hypothetical protein